MNAAAISVAIPGFEVVRLGGNIGAEIRGLDLRRPMAAERFERLHAAFIRHEVLVFRDQDIMLDEQMAFARLFGGLSIHPFSPNLEANPMSPQALNDFIDADAKRFADLVKSAGIKAN